MKKLIWLLLLLPLAFGGNTDKYEYKYKIPFAPIIYSGINDSIPTIDQFGRIRNGIIVENIVSVLNTDPSGVKLTRAELDYIRAIVGGLYVTGMWQKSLAIYGFVGGNEWKHKWNWKDMRDLDAAFRLTFSGTIVQNSNGFKGGAGNGDGYADLNFNMSSNLSSPNNMHMSVYINQSSTTSSPLDFAVSSKSSSGEDGTNRYFITGSFPFGGNFFTQSAIGNSNQSALSFSRTVNNFKGCVIASRIASNSLSMTYLNLLYKNTSTQDATTLPNYSPVLGGARYSNGIFNPSNAVISFTSVGSGLTDQQAISSSQIITYSQGILNRK